MKTAMSAWLLFAVLASATASRMQVTPVEKVLQALGEMKAKAEASMAKEQKVYAEYAEWADDRTKELGFEIKTGESNIEELLAFIEKSDNKVAQLGNAIAELEADIARLTADKKDATAVREKEHAEYVKVSTDYSESVDALERAIQIMTAQAYDRPQAEMLLQQMAKTTPGMTRVLAAFLQEKERQDGAPTVAAYDFQSGGIIDLLEGLLKKFKGELADVEEEESNEAHYYDLEMIHLTDTITKSTSDSEEKSVLKSKTAAASAKAKGDLADTRKQLADDKALKAEVEATFAAKSSTYEENQKVRKQELEALGKAIEIISDSSVAGSYKEHINLAQMAKVSLLQTESSKRRFASRKAAVELLQQRARKLSSKTLSSLLDTIAESPFAKVIGMIEDLIARLKAEAAAEAAHKIWCDEQLKANKLKRNKKTTKVNELSAAIAELNEQIKEMGQKIETLVVEQADLAKAMEEATAVRDKEKAANLDTIADAKAGSSAVKAAIAVLEEFYSKQAAFVQQVPEMQAYKGLQGSPKGITGMLEVILTDFERLAAETTATEDQAAQEYSEFMSEATASKKVKHDSEVKLRLEKDQAEFKVSQTQKDLDANQKELDKANEYFEYLKPACLEVHVSYEERAAKRKEEIAALNEAWEILDQKSG
jgi:transcription antitermination factor NusG